MNETPFEELVKIMYRLRRECPWDKEQTHDSLIPYMIEETYEVIDTIRSKDKKHLEEELGDLLLQVVFHAELATQSGDFNIDDVCRGITQKLIRRHPHVFGDTNVSSADDVIKNWDQIKQEEKKNQQDSYLESVPKSLPALFQSYKLCKKASKVGFDWPETQNVFDKIEEEFRELREAITEKNSDSIRHELGDILFSISNLCRFLKAEPEEALQECNGRFRKRFELMEQNINQQGLKMDALTLKEWDQFWNEAKKKTK